MKFRLFEKIRAIFAKHLVTFKPYRDVYRLVYPFSFGERMCMGFLYPGLIVNIHMEQGKYLLCLVYANQQRNKIRLKTKHFSNNRDFRVIFVQNLAPFSFCVFFDLR